MFRIFFLLCGIIFKVALNLKHSNLQVKSCHMGDVVRNECNRCLCTSKSIFECIALPCDKDRLQKTYDNYIQTCSANQLYIQSSKTCICNEDGRWPHKACHESFQSLPTKNIETHKCEPNTYAMIDCNICRCGPDGEFITDRCTRNNCADDPESRRNVADNKKSNVYSNCKINTWYSLGPCQFCYCVKENKLLCNTNNYNSNLTIGSYEFRECGKELIKEALELLPDKTELLRISSNTSKNLEQESTDTILEADDNDVVEKDSVEITGTPKSNNDVDISNQMNNKEDVSDSKEDVNTFTTTMKVTTVRNPSSVASLVRQKLKSTDQYDYREYSGEDNDEDYSKEIPLTTSIYARNKKTPHNLKSESKNVKNKLPKSLADIDDINKLNKVLKIVLRKSMVSLSGKTECVPGTESVKECNTCFCMKNGKLLCTANKCK